MFYFSSIFENNVMNINEYKLAKHIGIVEHC